MRSSLLIPAETVDANQMTATPVPADAVNVSGLGAQVIHMALISRGRMRDAVHVDG